MAAAWLVVWCAAFASPASAAFDLTSREILASGDVAEGFGPIGVGSFATAGIDGHGRVLVWAQLSDGVEGLYWADGASIEALWTSAESDQGLHLSSAQSDADGRVVAVDRGSGKALYEVTNAGVRPLVSVGDSSGGGRTFCAFGEFAIAAGGALAFSAGTVPLGVPCEGVRQQQGVFLLNGGRLRRIAGPAEPDVDLNLLGVARDGTVAVDLEGFARVLIIGADGTQRTLAAVDVAPSGRLLQNLVGLGISPTGEVVFAGEEDRSSAAIYRTDGDRFVRVVGRGDQLADGGVVDGVEYVARINGGGEVAVRVSWRVPPGGTAGFRHGLVVCPVGGACRPVGARALADGFNDSGDVALTEAEPTRVMRWRGGQLQTLFTAGDAAPNGAVFAVGGIQEPYCLAADGRVGSGFVGSSHETGLLCVDAQGAHAISRVGDPSPDGGPLAWFSQCAIADGDQFLFAAARYDPVRGRTEGHSIYRATRAGIERVLGPGIESNGIVVYDLRNLGHGRWGTGRDVFVANDAGTVLAGALTRTGVELLRRRRGGPLERIDFALGSDSLRRSVASIQWAALAADDTVVATAILDGVGAALLASNGERARVIATAPEIPAPDVFDFGELLVHGTFASTIAYGGEVYRLLLVSLGDGTVGDALAPLPQTPEVDPPWWLVGLTGQGRLLVDEWKADVGLQRLFVDGETRVSVWDGAYASTAPVAANDRVNLLGAPYDPLVEMVRHRLTLSGPSPEARCFVPPTAVPRPVSTLTPTPTPLANTPSDPSGLVLKVGTASGHPGDLVSLEVRLRTGAYEVAGVQNDLLFVPGAPFAPRADGSPACRVNPDIYKNATAAAFLPHGCQPGVDCQRLRVLVLAYDNSDPIADGSSLYTCDVAIDGAAAPGRHPIAVEQFLASDSMGNQLTGTASPGAVAVLAGHDTSASARVAPGDGDGCQLGAGASGGAWLLHLIALALAARAAHARDRAATTRPPRCATRR